MGNLQIVVIIQLFWISYRFMGSQYHPGSVGEFQQYSIPGKISVCGALDKKTVDIDYGQGEEGGSGSYECTEYRRSYECQPNENRNRCKSRIPECHLIVVAVSHGDEDD